MAERLFLKFTPKSLYYACAEESKGGFWVVVNTKADRNGANMDMK